ncbi:MAG: hypothetical protein MZV70_51515 [Desulfobacterales bacterium]|nr:hypothetical protein [Desulfobacterales bacterium]
MLALRDETDAPRTAIARPPCVGLGRRHRHPGVHGRGLRPRARPTCSRAPSTSAASRPARPTAVCSHAGRGRAGGCRPWRPPPTCSSWG